MVLKNRYMFSLGPGKGITPRTLEEGTVARFPPPGEIMAGPPSPKGSWGNALATPPIIFRVRAVIAESSFWAVGRPAAFC